MIRYIRIWTFFCLSITQLIEATVPDITPWIYDKVDVITGQLRPPLPYITSDNSLNALLNEDLASFPTSQDSAIKQEDSSFRQWHYDDQGRLVELTLRRQNEELMEVIERITWTYTENGSYELIDARGRKYLVSIDDQGHEKIIGPDGKISTYSYDTKSGKLQSYNLFNAAKTTVHYSEKEQVSTLKLEDPSGTLHTLLELNYFPESNFTDVWNASGEHIRYRYDGDHLIAKEFYGTHPSPDQPPLYSERYFWTQNDCKLAAYALMDSDNKALLLRSYHHNIKGQLEQETLWGNLSGKGSGHFLLSEKGQILGHQPESYSHYYSYDDQERLSESWTDDGLKTHYNYLGSSDLLASLLVIDDEKIHLRTFYHYDNLGNIIESLVDDGCGTDYDDFTGVTHRRSLKFIYSEEGATQPYITDETYYDFAQAETIIQKTAINSYDPHGRCTSTQHIDSDQVCYGTSFFAYDELGRTLSTVEGETYQQYRYDAQGRITLQRDSTTGKTQAITYNTLGQVVAFTETDAKGNRTHHSYRYDEAGHCIEHIDPCGHSSYYNYDSLGRLTTMVLPEVMTVDGKLTRPQQSREYDLMGNVTMLEDTLGHRTKLSYNIRGQLTAIFHPDGTSETYTYNLDGTLLESCSREGQLNHYERDSLHRVTEKTLLLNDGSTLSTTAEYGSWFLESLCDPMGRTMHYEHSDAGMLSKVTTEWEGSHGHREYSYDPQGRTVGATQWYGEGDPLQIQLERSSNGTATSLNLLDSLNSTHIHQRYNLQGQASSGEILQDIDVNWEYHNEYGQQVCCVTMTTSEGKVEKHVHDPLGRIVENTRLDRFGQEIKRSTYCYDLLGNKLLETHGTGDTTQTTRYGYSPQGHCQWVIEHENTPQASQTSMEYTPEGRLCRLKKPNGVVLKYSYDNHGRISNITSDDGSIDYSYSYNTQGQIKEVHDAVLHRTSTRTFHPLGPCEEDTMAHGLAINKSYDHAGHLTRLELPDGSYTTYSYSHGSLTEISRWDAEGQQRYQHRYSRYSQDGAILEMELAGNAGKLAFDYDEEGHLKRMTSSYTSLRFPSDGYTPQGQCARVRYWDPKGCTDICGSYDASGQLIEEKGVYHAQYLYDAVGNRLSDGQEDYLYDTAHQLVQKGESTFHYDANGNMIQWNTPEETKTFSYDALDRLIEVEVDQLFKIQYTYDGLNRRLSRSRLEPHPLDSRWTLTDEIFFLYDDDQEIGCIGKEGKIIELRILGQGIASEVGAAVTIELDDRVFVPIHDHRGTVSCLIDSVSGTVQEFYRHSAFGVLQAYHHNGDTIEAKECLCPWRFGSQRVDNDLELIFFGRRDYSPALGRWLSRDPAGYLDSTNRYLFARNSPLTLIDPDGRVSVYGIWNALTSTVFNYLRTLGSIGCSFADLMDGNISLFGDIMDDFEFVSYQLIGPTIFMLAGLGSEPLEFGIYGNGEFNDKVRVSHINGILNNRELCMEAAGLISRSHGGVNVHYIFRPTDGLSGDLINGFFTVLGFTSPNAKGLAEGWRELIEEVGGVGGGGIIVHYAHSLGGAETACARLLLSAEEQKMIRVTTFGSAKMLKNEGFYDVHNYISRKDGVMIVDVLAYFSAFMDNESNTTFLESLLDGFPYIDHEFVGPTYTALIEELGQRFNALYNPSQFDIIYIDGERR